MRIAKIALVALLLVWAVAMSVVADTEVSATVSGTDVYVSGDFIRDSLGWACTITRFSGYTAVWSPDDSCDTKPTIPVTIARNNTHCNFRIISPDGNCLHFDSRLSSTTWGTAPGVYGIDFHFPLEVELTADQIEFSSSSDMDVIDLDNYYQDESFAVRRGEEYLIQIVSQCDKCVGQPDDGQVVLYSYLFSVPCCIQRVGDANCSGGDEPTIGDITAIREMLFGNQNPVCCMAEADVNQSGGADPTVNDVTIGDMSILVDYLFIKNITSLNNCY